MHLAKVEKSKEIVDTVISVLNKVVILNKHKILSFTLIEEIK